MENKIRFKAVIGDEVFYPKGFYYQGKKHIVLVGDIVSGHTLRRKELIEDVEIYPNMDCQRMFEAGLAYLRDNGVDVNSFTEKHTIEALRVAVGMGGDV